MNNLDLTVAVAQLLLLALTFIIIPLVGQKYGSRAQDAAEKAIAGQGFEPGVLLQNGVKMTESKAEMLLPFAFALAYLTVAIIVLMNGQTNRTLLWIVEGFTFLVVGAVTAQQVFITAFLARAFKNAKDEHLHKIDVKQFIAAARAQFPSWLQGLQIARFALATAGSLVVVALLK
jgi:hypothetical protein